MWVRKLFTQRRANGEFNILVQDLMLFDLFYFFRMFQMNPSRFEELQSWVAPSLIKCSKCCDVATPSESLCITLWYLATGDAQATIASCYRVSPPVVGRIIRNSCDAIWTILNSKEYLKAPANNNEWMEIENEFREKWNFPHCLGAIDGKHIVIQAPPRSGSDYFNYKKTHSIVLLAVCNARYEFTLVDIGQAGRQSDGGVYKNSNLGYAIDQNLLNVPAPSNDMSSDGKYYPYVFVADDAFQMKEYMLKPYPRSDRDIEKRVFDYRLSRARRIIENSFGILAARFRIFRRPINAQVETVCSITKAAVALHNYLMKSQCIFGEYTYSHPGFVDQDDFGEERKGEWRAETTGYTGMVSATNLGTNNYSRAAKEVRDSFKRYFSSNEGMVSWQLDYATRTMNPFDDVDVST